MTYIKICVYLGAVAEIEVLQLFHVDCSMDRILNVNPQRSEDIMLYRSYTYNSYWINTHKCDRYLPIKMHTLIREVCMCISKGG